MNAPTTHQTIEQNVFEDLLAEQETLHKQGFPLPASTNSTQVLFKQLWDN